MKKLSCFFTGVLFICAAQGQVRTPTLYVTGTVLSEEKMLVSVLGTKTIEGNVVSAELNGKKTEAKTDNKGHAILNFSAIAGGLAGSGVAVIKTFDKNGNLIGTANTTVENGRPALVRPVIDPLPKNLSNGEAVTIPGRNLGADAKLTCGDKVQQTFSAADREMTVFTNAKTGEQQVFVTTPNGVSESQTVNVYNLDFSLPKSSVKPRENIQAMVHYESIPVGTKLIFTNKSPQTITMTIPGGQNAANECVYTVSEQNGTIPVNITGLTRGNFVISLDPAFTKDRKDPAPAKKYGSGIKLNSPANGATIKKLSDLTFNWSGAEQAPDAEYEIVIKKLRPNQREADAFKANPEFFSKARIQATNFNFPASYPHLDTGKYVWSVRPVRAGNTNKPEAGFQDQQVFYIPAFIFIPLGSNPPTEPTMPCPPPKDLQLWGSHYYPCRITEYFTTQPGLTIAQQEALKKSIKKIKEIPVIKKGAKLAELIAKACSIHGIYNLWIHIEQPYDTPRYDYECVNGTWVLKNIHKGPLMFNDLGWVRIYIGGGVGTYEINGTESDAEIQTAIDEALANACK
jgi:hypothetical protein